MISIYFHKNFEKKYKVLKNDVKEKIKERLERFEKDEFDPTLNNHSLNGKFKGYRSINIKGDLRMLYVKKNNNQVFFVDIDNHNNLYK